MGTRGYIVFRYKNKNFALYCHSDSYPEYIGELIVILIKTQNRDNWIKKIDKLLYNPVKFIDKEINEIFIKKYEKVLKELEDEYVDFDNKKQIKLDDILDINCNFIGMLLEKLANWILQAPILEVQDSVIEFEITERPFIEWTYIINLDDNKFEVYAYYIGELKKEQQKNWKEYMGYTGIFDLDKIPFNWRKCFVRKSN